MKEFCLIVSLTLTQTPFHGRGKALHVCTRFGPREALNKRI